MLSSVSQGIKTNTKALYLGEPSTLHHPCQLNKATERMIFLSPQEMHSSKRVYLTKYQGALS